MTEYKLNSRQHRFCLNILAGMPPQEAYAKAGYSDNPVNLATRPYDILQEAPQVRAFIEEKRRLKEAIILSQDVNNTIATPQERKQILTELLRAQLVDFQDEKGEPKLTKDTPHARAAKEHYHRQRIDQNGNPVITKSIKLADPIAAIQELNKMDGSYAPSKHLHGHVQFRIVHKAERKDRGNEDFIGGDNIKDGE